MKFTANALIDDAYEGAQAGRKVFAARLHPGPISRSARFTGPLQGLAELIEGIERHGWRLDQLKVVDDGYLMILRAIDAPAGRST